MILRGVKLGRLPFLSLAEVVSLVIWAAVLFELWIERRYRLPVFRAVVLPGVLVTGKIPATCCSRAAAAVSMRCPAARGSGPRASGAGS